MEIFVGIVIFIIGVVTGHLAKTFALEKSGYKIIYTPNMFPGRDYIVIDTRQTSNGDRIDNEEVYKELFGNK